MGYGIGAVQFGDGDLYRPQIVQATRVEGMKAEEIAFIQLNNTAIADSVAGTSATFNGVTIATVPSGFTALTKDDFEVYINGRLVPSAQVNSVTQQGSSALDYAIAVSINTAAFFGDSGAVLEDDDEVVLAGKFNNV